MTNEKYNKKNDTKRTVASFAAASGLNDVGSDMVRPFWPIFVTQVLGAPMAFLGLIDGLGDAIAQSIKFPAGYLSDRYKKRKQFIWFGYLLAGLSRIGYALSKFASWLIPFKIMDRLGKLRDPPRDAMLSDITQKNKRGRAFGILTAADNFGAFLGPILAFLLIMFIGYREIFYIAAIPSLIGAFIIFKFVREERFASKRKFHFNRKKLSRNYKTLLLASSIFSLSWFSLSFLVVFVSKYIDVVLVPFLFILMSAMAALISIPAGRASDSVGRKPVLILGYILFVIVCLGFVFFQTQHALITSFVLFAVYGLHYGIVTTIQSPFVADISPKEIRASAIGLYQTITGICLLPASLVAGILWDVFSAQTAFVFAISLAISGIVILAVFVKEERDR